MRGIFTMRRFMCLRYYAEAKVLRCSHLNAALVANEENVPKAECLGLMSMCFWLGFRISMSRFLSL